MPLQRVPTKGQPFSRQVIGDQGVVEFDGSGAPKRIWTRYGDEKPNPWLNEPLPNLIYIVGASRSQRAKRVRLTHIYRTTFDASTECAEAVQVRRFKKSEAGRRWGKHLCAPVGFPGGKFDRGHLIAAELGAGMEAINLVSMPQSSNRSHKPATALRNGFRQLAELGNRFRNDESYLKGSLAHRGEFILPNYRLFEIVLGDQASRGYRLGYDVSLRVRPTTVHGITDVLYGEIWLGEKVIRYVLDNDVDR